MNSGTADTFALVSVNYFFRIEGPDSRMLALDATQARLAGLLEGLGSTGRTCVEPKAGPGDSLECIEIAFVFGQKSTGETRKEPPCGIRAHANRCRVANGGEFREALRAGGREMRAGRGAGPRPGGGEPRRVFRLALLPVGDRPQGRCRRAVWENSNTESPETEMELWLE